MGEDLRRARGPATGERSGQRGATRSGYTDLELLISLSLMALIMSAISIAVLASRRAHDDRLARVELETRGHRALDRMALQLSEAGRATLFPDPSPPLGTSTLSYQRDTGFSDGEIEWGPTRRLEFQYEESDPDNGLDDDGDGLIDEGLVVWVESSGEPDERELVLVRGVREFLEGEFPNGEDDNGNGLIDERGLSFDIAGETITVRLTLERRDDRGRLLTQTVETSVRVRN